MVTLWEKMGQLFGAKWLRQYGTTDDSAFDTWCQFLADLSPEQIRQGFVNMMRDKPKYLPDAVQFRDYCMAAHGIPPLEAAYEEACLAKSPKLRHKWSHPAVYHAGRLTGWSDLHMLTRDEGLKRFRYNYEIMCRRVANGEDINLDVPEAIPATVHVRPTPEQAARKMAELREAVKL